MLSLSRTSCLRHAARYMSGAPLLLDGHVQLEVQDRVAVIRLNNPSKLNALDLAMVRACVC